MPVRAVLIAAAVASFCVASLAQEATTTTPSAPVANPTKTGKERLVDKASDEQRVDNCGVPPEKRGTKPRPDSCDRGAAPTD